LQEIVSIHAESERKMPESEDPEQIPSGYAILPCRSPAALPSCWNGSCWPQTKQAAIAEPVAWSGSSGHGEETTSRCGL